MNIEAESLSPFGGGREGKSAKEGEVSMQILPLPPPEGDKRGAQGLC